MSTPQSIGIEASLSRRLFLVTTISMLVAAALSILATLQEFDTRLRPFLVAKTESVALKVRNDLEYALSLGIPFEELRGVDEFVSELNRNNPEVRDISVVAGPAERSGQSAPPADTRLFAAFAAVSSVLTGSSYIMEPVTVDIASSGQIVGHVSARVNEQYVIEQMQSVFFDSVVILMSVVLVALEVVVVLAGHQITEPLRRVESAIARRASGDLSQYQMWGSRGLLNGFIAGLNSTNAALRERALAIGSRTEELVARHKLSMSDPRKQATIIDARIPLFVFCVAEELQKSFLPLFVAEYYQPTDLFDKSIMIGLPISCFMFVIAAITPFAAGLVDKYGNRRLFLLGLIPALAGYLGCYFAQSANHIVLARSMTAIGYAVITISAQSYIAAIVTKENRARGMAIFVGVLMAATMCGTAIGGILADWLGYKPVFLVSILLACIAGVLGFVMLGAEVGAAPAANSTGPKRNPIAILARNSQFVLIVLFCAIPAKIILTGFLYLFVPIYLASLEATQSEIGRIMMLYSLIIIPISPLASRFADKLDKNLTLVIVATILSGIVLVGLYDSTSVAAVLSVVVALGIAHSFIKAPLIVAAMEAAEASPDISRTAALSLLRTFERVGSVIGPVIVASMLVWLDYQTTAAILGLGVAFVGIVMAAITLGGGKKIDGVAHE